VFRVYPLDKEPFERLKRGRSFFGQSRWDLSTVWRPKTGLLDTENYALITFCSQRKPLVARVSYLLALDAVVSHPSHIGHKDMKVKVNRIDTLPLRIAISLDKTPTHPVYFELVGLQRNP
jgi:hypothetical protein